MTKLKLLCLCIVLLCLASGVAAQAPQLVVYNGYVAPAGYPFGPATIAVCASGGSGGPPCSPLTLIYTDASGTRQQPNPFTIDPQGNGNFHFFANCGTNYALQSYGNGYTTTLTTITTSVCTGGGGGTPTGPASGDLNGSYPAPNVVKINAATVPTTKTIVGTNASGQIIDATNTTLTNPLSVVHNPASVTISGATPSVSGGNAFITNNGSATTITNFTGGVDSQTITVNCGDANTTIANNANIVTFSGGNIACLANQATEFTFYSSLGKWVQIGGSGQPAGSPVQAQFNNSGVFGASSCVNLPTIAATSINFDCDTHPKGLNPYLDVTRYGARSCTLTAAPCISAITATTSAGNPVVTVSSASFISGDGVTLFNVGPAITMSTPAAPTVTPSVANVLTGTRMVTPGPAGSTTYTYQVFAEDKGGGFTPASASGTTATGQASLGAQSVGISSCTRSGTGVTCTTTGPHGYAIGTAPQYVVIGGTSDPTFNGDWTTSNVADSTHFTFQGGQNTFNGSSTTTTGGSVTWWNCNHITWTRVSGAYRYWIVGRTSGSLTTIGVSWPENPLSTAIAGVPLTEGVNTWDDFGTSVVANLGIPHWIPTTPPASAGNDNLTTTVSSGGGTTTLTLAAAPSVNGAPGIVLDAVPAILAAQAAASGSGGTALPVYFPATANPQTIGYPINSYLDLTGSFNTSLLVNGTLQVNNTIALTRFSKIIGYYNSLNTGTSFAFDSLPIIYVGNAYPGIHIMNGLADHLEGVSIEAPVTANNALLVVQDFGGANPGAFYNRVEFSTGGANDLNGTGLLVRGVPGQLSAQLTLTDVLFIPGAPSATTISATPSFLCADCALVYVDHIQASHRGMYMGIDQSGGGIQSTGFYFQGSVTPAISFASADGNPGAVAPSQSAFNGQSTMDSTGNPLLWFGPGGQVTQLYIEHVGVTALGTNTITGLSPGLISGRSPFSFSQPLGVNWNTEGAGNACTDDGFYATPGNPCTNISTFYSTMPVAVAPSAALFMDQLAGAAPTVALTTGGSLSLTAHTYTVAPIWQNGGVGKPYATSAPITPTSGNQSVIVTWTPQAGCKGYLLIRDNAVVAVPYIVGCNVGTFTDTGLSGGGTVPGVSGGGPTMLMPGTQGISSSGPLWAPQANLFASNSNVMTLGPTGTLSTNRNATFPDITGYVPTTGYQNSNFDNFNRANETPLSNGGKWTQNAAGNTINLTSNLIGGAVAGVYDSAFWNAGTFTSDQFSEAILVNTGSLAGAAVRMVGSSGVGTWYACVDKGPSNQMTITRALSGTTTDLVTTTITSAAGDIIRTEIQGTTIKCYQNSVLISTTTDGNIASGSPGVVLFGSSFADNWSGGNIHPIAQLDTEQDWVQPQHIISATIGPNQVFGSLTPGSLALGAFVDYLGSASAPVNPPTGYCREYFNTTTGFIQGVNSSGTTCTAGAISGMTSGQVAIAGSAATITSSKAIQGTDANMLSSSTVSGTAATLCTDANGGATTVGCTGGSISGLTTGQVPIAGSASSLTSSKALQGTDANILTSSTVAAGAGNLLCTDTGSGATTSGCAVFNTQSAATNTNIAATNMVASTSALHSYLFQWTISLTAVGVACTSSTTININAIFTDPNVSTTTTELLGQITIAAGGNGVVGFVAQGTDNILAKSATAVQYSTSGYTPGTGCTTNPTYQVSPTLVQLW